MAATTTTDAELERGGGAGPADDPQRLYLEVRRREGRLLADAEVARLPEIARDHPLAGEWRIRAASAREVLAAVEASPAPRRVLDLGCGNGWFCRRLAEAGGSEVWGVDPNREELDQARRVFARVGGLHFSAADIFADTVGPGRFEIITLGSCVQYFPRLDRLLDRLAELLAAGGTIHLFDSPLYPSDGARAEARERSRSYYRELGVPAMAEHYHHHTLAELRAAAPGELTVIPPWHPSRLQSLLGRVPRPFPRVEIRTSPP